MAKELLKKEAALGEYGNAQIVLMSDAKVKVSVQAEVDILLELEKLAAKSETKLDDNVVLYIKNLVAMANAAI